MGIMVGHKKETEGKVQSVYRRRRCICIEKVVKEKQNGQQAQLPVHPSNSLSPLSSLTSAARPPLRTRTARFPTISTSKLTKWTERELELFATFTPPRCAGARTSGTRSLGFERLDHDSEVLRSCASGA